MKMRLDREAIDAIDVVSCSINSLFGDLVKGMTIRPEMVNFSDGPIVFQGFRSDGFIVTGKTEYRGIKFVAHVFRRLTTDSVGYKYGMLLSHSEERPGDLRFVEVESRFPGAERTIFTQVIRSAMRLRK